MSLPQQLLTSSILYVLMCQFCLSKWPCLSLWFSFIKVLGILKAIQSLSDCSLFLILGMLILLFVFRVAVSERIPGLRVTTQVSQSNGFILMVLLTFLSASPGIPYRLISKLEIPELWGHYKFRIHTCIWDFICKDTFVFLIHNLKQDKHFDFLIIVFIL